MGVLVKRGVGFFTVRGDGVQVLGPTWPSGAVASFARRKSAAVLARDRVRVSDGLGLDDQLEFARQQVEGGKEKSVSVARLVGRLDSDNVYERVWDVLAPDATAVEFSKAVDKAAGRETKTVHLRMSKAAGSRRISGMASTPAIDRDNDIVDPAAFVESMPQFMKNPVMLWMHDAYRPVGKVVDFAVRPDGLWVEGEIVDEDVWRLIDREVVRAMSVSFVILDRGLEQVGGGNGDDLVTIRRIKKAELLEISVVTIPANREALFAVSKSLKCGDDLVCRGCRCSSDGCECSGAAAVVEHRPFKQAGSGPVDYRRESVAALGGSEAVRLAKLFDGEGKAALTHHGAQDGDVVTSVEAVRAGLAALVGYGKVGAVEITEDERVAAWKHLCTHLIEAGVPETPEVPKGPEPERTAALLGGTDSVRGTWALRFSVSKFQDAPACRAWLRAHGFGEAEKRADVDGWRCFGAEGGEDLESHALDDGVRAVLIRRSEGHVVNVSKSGASDAAAKPEAPAAAAEPAKPEAPKPAADPAATKAEAPKAGEEMVEIDTDDLHALEHPDSVDADALDRAVRNVVESDAS